MTAPDEKSPSLLARAAQGLAAAIFPQAAGDPDEEADALDPADPDTAIEPDIAPATPRGRAPGPLARTPAGPIVPRQPGPDIASLAPDVVTQEDIAEARQRDFESLGVLEERVADLSAIERPPLTALRVDTDDEEEEEDLLQPTGFTPAETSLLSPAPFTPVQSGQQPRAAFTLPPLADIEETVLAGDVTEDEDTEDPILGTETDEQIQARIDRETAFQNEEREQRQAAFEQAEAERLRLFQIGQTEAFEELEKFAPTGEIAAQRVRNLFQESLRRISDFEDTFDGGDFTVLDTHNHIFRDIGDGPLFKDDPEASITRIRTYIKNLIREGENQGFSFGAIINNITTAIDMQGRRGGEDAKDGIELASRVVQGILGPMIEGLHREEQDELERFTPDPGEVKEEDPDEATIEFFKQAQQTPKERAPPSRRGRRGRPPVKAPRAPPRAPPRPAPTPPRRGAPRPSGPGLVPLRRPQRTIVQGQIAERLPKPSELVRGFFEGASVAQLADARFNAEQELRSTLGDQQDAKDFEFAFDPAVLDRAEDRLVQIERLQSLRAREDKIKAESIARFGRPRPTGQLVLPAPDPPERRTITRSGLPIFVPELENLMNAAGMFFSANQLERFIKASTTDERRAAVNAFQRTVQDLDGVNLEAIDRYVNVQIPDPVLRESLLDSIATQRRRIAESTAGAEDVNIRRGQETVIVPVTASQVAEIPKSINDRVSERLINIKALVAEQVNLGRSPQFVTNFIAKRLGNLQRVLNRYKVTVGDAPVVISSGTDPVASLDDAITLFQPSSATLKLKYSPQTIRGKPISPDMFMRDLMDALTKIIRPALTDHRGMHKLADITFKRKSDQEIEIIIPGKTMLKDLMKVVALILKDGGVLRSAMGESLTVTKTTSGGSILEFLMGLLVNAGGMQIHVFLETQNAALYADGTLAPMVAGQIPMMVLMGNKSNRFMRIPIRHLTRFGGGLSNVIGGIGNIAGSIGQLAPPLRVVTAPLMAVTNIVSSIGKLFGF